MNNAVIVGLGMVGNATAHALGIKKYIDIQEKDAPEMELVDYKQAAECRYVFICLPTPTHNGRYKTDDILSVIDAIKQQGKQNVFIIRSTVYPGFARHAMRQLNTNSVVSNPEFLTEDTWKRDAEKPDVIVVGADQPNYLKDVVGIYQARHRGVDLIQTDTVTAEMAKLTVNGLYSTKVVFANQMYDYAKAAGANYETIKNLLYKRKWIGKNHLEVWHKDGRGAGGSCLPKDLEALSTYSGRPLFREVLRLNSKYLQETSKK